MAGPDHGVPDRGNDLIKLIWSLAGLSFVILVTGLYAKIRLLRRVRSSDYVVILAFVCLFVP
jgi:hypothetical protein